MTEPILSNVQVGNLTGHASGIIPWKIIDGGINETNTTNIVAIPNIPDVDNLAV